jgi:hypothetical protein
VRRAFVILVSLLLMATQRALPLSAPAAAKPAACANCHCGRPDCCVERPASPSQPGPAAPQSSQTQNDWLALPAIRPHVLYVLAPDRSAILSVSPSLPGVRAVPLYRWNCSFLI